MERVRTPVVGGCSTFDRAAPSARAHGEKSREHRPGPRSHAQKSARLSARLELVEVKVVSRCLARARSRRGVHARGVENGLAEAIEIVTCRLRDFRQKAGLGHA